MNTLAANYTDSEGEEESREVGSPESARNVALNNSSDNSDLTPTKPKSKNLVSYHDDTVLSDDEQSERAVSESPVLEIQEPPFTDHPDLPPEPQGRCSFELQEKIKKLYDKMRTDGLDMNLEIQLRKEFRNPSIYEKLIQFCGINELGTNYSAEVYDPLRWNKSSFYDELAKVQKAEMDQREKERKEKTKVEVIVGTAKRLLPSNSSVVVVAEDDKKRKSKWDQVATTALTSLPKLTAPLTTTVSGTKGTVISAFGTLNKKPRN